MSRPRTRRTDAAVQEYIDSAGGHCPCCGSKDIEPGRVQAARGRATGDFECFACHARWRDVYMLSTIEVVGERDGGQRSVQAAAGVAVTAATLDALLDAADARAALEGDPCVAVADLRDLMRTAWRMMTPAQRTALSREHALAALTAASARGTAVGSVNRRV